LGARFERAVSLGSSTLALRAKVAWAHDWVSDPIFTAAFQMLPTASFLVSGATPPTDLALVSAGGEPRFANSWALAPSSTANLPHASTYGGTGTIRYSW